MPESFDELARALAVRIPRRHALRLIAGTLAATAFHSVFRATAAGAATCTLPTGKKGTVCEQGCCDGAGHCVCERLPYEEATKCCERAGVLAKNPIPKVFPDGPGRNLQRCPNRVPTTNPNYVAVGNGCGPDPAAGCSGVKVPDNPTGASFSTACNNHDLCYGKCNKTRRECDSNFHLDLVVACATTYPPTGPINRALADACLQVANAYYLAVHYGGGCAYEYSQRQACDCCPGCTSCNPPCATNQTCCGDKCVDTNTDSTNCGSCDNVCGSAETCCDKVCVNVQTDPKNCGGCGHVCPSGQTCAAGVCQECNPLCSAGQTCCNHVCVDTKTSADNCGACGEVCPSGQTCTSGQCTGDMCNPPCTGGQTCCPDVNVGRPPICADLQTDGRFCGDCKSTCGGEGSAGCRNGTCTCISGYFPCAYPATFADGRTYTFNNCCQSSTDCCSHRDAFHGGGCNTALGTPVGGICAFG